MNITNQTFNKLDIMMPHGRIPKEVLEEIWALSNEDKDSELAFKLAVASIEYSLCGTTNYEDDKSVMRELRHYKNCFNHNLDSYNAECEIKVYEKRLEDILEMYYNQHMTQSQIGAKLGINQGEISKRMKLAREHYPELIAKYSK